jgi:hypothetical protein
MSNIVVTIRRLLSSLCPLYKLQFPLLISCFECFSTFTPIPALMRQDADVSIHFLATSAQYLSPINDPWFLSQDPVVVPGLFNGDNSTNTTVYMNDYSVSAVACTTQSQLCSIQSGQCSELGAEVPFQDGSELSSIFTESQMPILNRLASTSFSHVPLDVGSANLLASAHCWYETCDALPENQWQLEFSRYFNTWVTNMQLNSLVFVSGPLDPVYQPYWLPASTEDSWMCSSQIVVRSDYLSFSVLGVALIMSIGGLIILLNISFDKMLGFFRKERGEAAKEWQHMSLFQMQRVALEGCQLGSWRSLEKDVPTTNHFETFPYFHKAVEGKRPFWKISTNSTMSTESENLQSPTLSTDDSVYEEKELIV